MSDEYTITAETPSPEDYCRLRVAAGLSPKSLDQARLGLPHTFHAVVVRREGRAIGMGRAIGDGALFLQIVDIAVEPAHQGRGLGKKIMAALMRHIKDACPGGTYVSLIADGEAKNLYRRFGFAETAPASVGMALKI
jgi:ribosomal protein S18 acetylase RimI-like enzyme